MKTFMYISEKIYYLIKEVSLDLSCLLYLPVNEQNLVGESLDFSCSACLADPARGAHFAAASVWFSSPFSFS